MAILPAEPPYTTITISNKHYYEKHQHSSHRTNHHQENYSEQLEIKYFNSVVCSLYSPPFMGPYWLKHLVTVTKSQ